ncbi:ileal sodium/bile acid cotransporter-like [Glandiceps talaboti]
MATTTEMMSTADTNSTVMEQLAPHLLTLQKVDQYMIYVIMVLIMIGMGGQTEVPELKKSLRRPWAILICWLSQFIIMPLLGFGLAHAANLPAEFAIGLIVQCSSPGGSLSNVFAYYARGNVTLSVCLTTCSTILAVGAMPLCLFLYGRSWTSGANFTVPYLIVTVTLLILLVPAAFGLLLRYKLPKYINKITNVCALIGTIGIVISIILRAYIKPDAFTSSWYIWLIALFLPMFAASLGFITSTIIRLPCSKRRTVGIETGCQNIALALSVINTSFPAGPQRARMLVISSLYGPIQIAELSLVIVIYRMLYKRGHCLACDYGDDDGNEGQEMVTKDVGQKTKVHAVTDGQLEKGWHKNEGFDGENKTQGSQTDMTPVKY